MFMILGPPGANRLAILSTDGNTIRLRRADPLKGSRLSHRPYYGGKIYGILSSVPYAYAHDKEAQALFEEVAGNLAFALRKIEAAKELSDRSGGA